MSRLSNLRVLQSILQLRWKNNRFRRYDAPVGPLRSACDIYLVANIPPTNECQLCHWRQIRQILERNVDNSFPLFYVHSADSLFLLSIESPDRFSRRCGDRPTASRLIFLDLDHLWGHSLGELGAFLKVITQLRSLRCRYSYFQDRGTRFGPKYGELPIGSDMSYTRPQARSVGLGRVSALTHNIYRINLFHEMQTLTGPFLGLSKLRLSNPWIPSCIRHRADTELHPEEH